MDKLDKDKMMQEGHVEKVIMKGEGLIREPSGKICFIPYVLPQEKILYQIDRERKDFDEGSLKELLEPHPLRTAPQCPHFGICEGCQLQHAPIELQRELKCSWLVDQFKRTCKQTPPPLPLMQPLEEWYYRRVVDFHWEKEAQESAGKLGYRNHEGKLIPITTCEIVRGGGQTVEKVYSFLAQTQLPQARVRYIQSNASLIVIELPSKEGVSTIIETLKNLWPYPGIDGHFLTYKFETLFHLGQQHIEEKIDGLHISWHGLGFLQNHLKGSLAFYKWLEERMLPFQEGALWLDLYCGTGVSALMAARQGWQVLAMEISAPAVEMARVNAKRNRLEASVSFEVQDLNRGLGQKWPSKKKLGGILVNPPRTGLSKPLIESINRSKCPRLLYLSCDPVTLCRDLQHFLSQGFYLKDWKAFDCFGQTSHFETAVWLERN